MDDVAGADAAADAAAPATAALAAVDVYTDAGPGAARGAIPAVAAAIRARDATGSKTRLGNSTDRSIVVLCVLLRRKLVPPSSDESAPVRPSDKIPPAPAPAPVLRAVDLVPEDLRAAEEEEEEVALEPGMRSCGWLFARQAVFQQGNVN